MPLKSFCHIVFCCLALASAWSKDFGGASHRLAYEGEPVKYYEQAPTNPVARLEQRLAAGKVTLDFDEVTVHVNDTVTKAQ